jgi:hypothetical protein
MLSREFQKDKQLQGQDQTHQGCIAVIEARSGS